MKYCFLEQMLGNHYKTGIATVDWRNLVMGDYYKRHEMK